MLPASVGLSALASSSTAPHVHRATAHAQRGLELASVNRQAEAVDALELSLSLLPSHAPTHVRP